MKVREVIPIPVRGAAMMDLLDLSSFAANTRNEDEDRSNCR